MNFEVKNLIIGEHLFINDKGGIQSAVCDVSVKLNTKEDDFNDFHETLIVISHHLKNKLLFIDGYSVVDSIVPFVIDNHGNLGQRITTPRFEYTVEEEKFLHIHGESYDEGLKNFIKESLSLRIDDLSLKLTDISIKMSITNPNTIAFVGAVQANENLLIKPLALFLAVEEREENWSPTCDTCENATKTLAKAFNALTGTIFYEDIGYSQDENYRWKEGHLAGLNRTLKMGAHTCPRYDVRDEPITVKHFGELIYQNFKETFHLAKIKRFSLYTLEGAYYHFTCDKKENYTELM